MVLSKIFSHWLLSCYRAARRLRSHGFFLLHKRPQPQTPPDVTNFSSHGHETLLCDFHGSLLRTHSLFPYFMLVAFEGGSLLRAFLLLLFSPVVHLLGHHRDLSVRVMTFITFCGLSTKNVDVVARAVLPKHYLDELHLHAYEALASAGKRVVVTSMPSVMAEVFLREYLKADVVIGAELHVLMGSYFTGLMRVSGLELKERALIDSKTDVGLVGPHDQPLISHCKQVYSVIKDDDAAIVPREKYPEPLVFHDGRLVFLPTPLATLSFFLFLPLGLLLSVVRIATGNLLPYGLMCMTNAANGVRLRVGGLPLKKAPNTENGHVLYVCTHRTLLDPVFLSVAVRRPVPAVTYSLSRMSEILAPMRTVALTRDRERDAATMRRLLAEGDLAVCPEGTTCREPYLLRFSSLFAELADDLVPVAVEARQGVLYGSTASGNKWLDPVLFLANPSPEYRMEFLDRVPKEMTCGAGKEPVEVANWIQRRLAVALGFECTGLTRKDKYMVLAGNEGVVVKKR